MTGGRDARTISIRGIVQGVGFRPFVYRLAHQYEVSGWVLNARSGVHIHAEGKREALDGFTDALASEAPPASEITEMTSEQAGVGGFDTFTIRQSAEAEAPTVRISPDLPVCDKCLDQLFCDADRRRGYPYINCTNCGPRYSIIEGLPYDRAQTTMRSWAMCADCKKEYEDPLDRRFHAQPVACSACGPQYFLRTGGNIAAGPVNEAAAAQGRNAITETSERLRAGQIVAVKGLGGYHLACDARSAAAVRRLRERKFRKEKPFAVMARDTEEAERLVVLTTEAAALLTSTPHPIVLAPARRSWPAVAPGNDDLGVMLPYAPLHHLLFQYGAPKALVMTSANRSSQPIAYRDEDAFERLEGIADAFLSGERPIARRIDDSVVRTTVFGPSVLRRARGYAPAAVAELPSGRPILAVGADLKNAVTLVVDGQAFVSQHIGDLDHYAARQAFEETIDDLLSMYSVPRSELLVVRDSHPGYASSRFAGDVDAEQIDVQHHRAHIASVLAERGAWDRHVIGFAFDGTGYGDDESIWGGEVFTGSLHGGFERTAHLRPALLAGGDAAARHPAQAAAGFLHGLEELPDLTAAPFHFPNRYKKAHKLVQQGVRTFPTTSVGRLFDTAAALLGFTREMTFEGQAAIWLEQQARQTMVGGDTPSANAAGRQAAPHYPFPDWDYGPLLQAVIADRRSGRPTSEIAGAFHSAIAAAVASSARTLGRAMDIDTIVLSGGVFQNQILLAEIHRRLRSSDLTVWTNTRVPPNDGGISLGQAAIGAQMAL